MREIKFRSWLKLKNEMLYKFTTMDHPHESENEKCVLMQYTGLKDKNGREIYEGDILQNKIGVRAKVVFYPEHAAYLASYVFAGNAQLDYLEGDEKVQICEVIGNIYENPELLEGSE